MSYDDKPGALEWLLAWLFCVGVCVLFWSLAYQAYQVMR